MEYKDEEILLMIDETSKLVAQQRTENLSSGAIAYQASDELAGNVEFWKWLDRNFSQSGIFGNVDSMQQYIAGGSGKENWLKLQLQGKGYEWDWMQTQRRSLKNILKTYDAGDVANRAASDVTERSILTGASKEYQMKAYTSKTNPNLKNTPKDMTVVTNAEKVDVVSGNGYESVESFQDAEKIKKATQKRLDEIKQGKAPTSYDFKSVGGTMAKAGLTGAAISITMETITQYKSWKNGNISGEDYLKEIMKAGGNGGITGAISSGIMIPIEATITAMGISAPITIPVAIVLGVAVDKVVSPCFGRGDYKKYLNKASYYVELDKLSNDMISSMKDAAEFYMAFVDSISIYSQKIDANLQTGKALDDQLSTLLNMI